MYDFLNNVEYLTELALDVKFQSQFLFCIRSLFFNPFQMFLKCTAKKVF